MFVILSLLGMPRVRSLVCILGIGLPIFARPYYILCSHVCPNFFDLFGQFFFVFLERLTVHMLGTALPLSSVR